MIKHGMCNDCARSVKLPFGYSVRFYDDGSFSGGQEVHDAGPFLDRTFSMNCINLGGLSAKVSSLEVYRNTSLGDADGYWESITGTSDLTYSVNVGFTSSRTEKTSIENQYSLSYEMSSGMQLEVFSASETINTSYSLAIKNDVENFYSRNYEEKITFTCERDPSDPDAGVGLWQWVVKSSDSQHKTKTNHYACRTGEGRFNRSPACPWNACIDGPCYECRTDWKA